MLTPGKKTLTKEEAVAILSIEFTKIYSKISKKFIEFLDNNNYNTINCDQWALMTVVFPILENETKYDLDGPCILFIIV